MTMYNSWSACYYELVFQETVALLKGKTGMICLIRANVQSAPITARFGRISLVFQRVSKW